MNITPNIINIEGNFFIIMNKSFSFIIKSTYLILPLILKSKHIFKVDRAKIGNTIKKY